METIEIKGKSYLIDTEKAIEQGLLKEKDNKPRSWREYDAAMDNGRYGAGEAVMFSIAESVFPTKEEATAFAALCRLIHLRDAWWGEWRPNWEEADGDIYVIYYNGDLDSVIVNEIETCYNSRTLAFPTEGMADDFLNTFRELIEQAKMFL